MEAGSLPASGSVWDMPWHPALVHFPIAFLFTASVLVLVRHTTGRATLERYIYQFRLGPTSKTIAQMMQLMTPERAARWAGSKASRLAY